MAVSVRQVVAFLIAPNDDIETLYDPPVNLRFAVLLSVPVRLPKHSTLSAPHSTHESPNRGG